MIAWDESHLHLYFAVSTVTAKNVPWIIFRYDLRTRSVTRIVNDYGGGFGNGQVSRSGQYLAYIQYGVMGVCGTSGFLVVADLWARRLGRVEYATATRDEIPIVQTLHWTSPTEIEYETEVHKETECRQSDNYPKQKIQARVKVNEIDFR